MVKFTKILFSFFFVIFNNFICCATQQDPFPKIIITRLGGTETSRIQETSLDEIKNFYNSTKTLTDKKCYFITFFITEDSKNSGIIFTVEFKNLLSIRKAKCTKEELKNTFPEIEFMVVITNKKE